ncbi:MAG: 4-(cytidine 5'-diphospho)-2-C-methyl-D-erythritol kinase [Pelagibacteraceae bacterium]|nr:4-(cytidine 5'-diphospho)-2-C-methyl-D-erythritol kinase [Pelagibacteraceae bacterium]
MRGQILKSYCKINLFLSVGRKLKRYKLHNIQSLIFFINLYDQIQIKKINSSKDNIKFFGKFSNYVNKKNNSITKSLSLLRTRGFINEKDKFKITVKKNVPVFSGFGGGSSNAAALIKFFTKKRKISRKTMDYFSKILGSDFRLFFYPPQLFQRNLFKITKFKKKYNFYFILVYPFLRSSTKNIYGQFRNYKTIENRNNYQVNSKLKMIQNMKFEENSLEKIVALKYPVIKKILNELKLIKNCQFSRITGSGSACFGLFLTQRSADLGLSKIKKKFPKFWCVIGKTI